MTAIRKLISVWMLVLLGSLLLPSVSIAALTGTTYDQSSTTTTTPATIVDRTSVAETAWLGSGGLQSITNSQAWAPFFLSRSLLVTRGLKGVPVETFEGTIRRRVLQSDVEAFRFSGGISDPKGRFLTTRQTLRQIDGSQDAQRVLQLPEGATAETLNRFTIPKGTEIFVGRVKGGPPGATQVFIRDPSVLR